MSYQQRPTIGNQGTRPTHPRSVQQGSPPFSMGGGGEFFSNPYGMQQQFNPGVGLSSVTTEGSGNLPVPAASTAVSTGKGGGLASLLSGGSSGGGSSSFNIAQVKQMIDRLGGIEGIMDTMGKVQKMVQSVQQMAPLVKMLVGSFGKKNSDDAGALPSGRKKRRKRKTTTATGKRRTKRRTSR